MRRPAILFLGATALLSGCLSHRAAVRGDVALLKTQPIQVLDECRLCMAGMRSSALGCAAANGKIEAVRALLAMGAKPTNCRGSIYGAAAFSPLGVAASHGETEIVKVLLAAKADPSYNDGIACPLHYAGDREDILKLLLDAGAEVDCRSPLSKMTPLEEAEKYGRSSAFRLLRKASARAKAELAQEAGVAAPPAPARPKTAGSDVDSPRYQLPERPDDFAVVVGVEKYAVDLPEARFAERDAAGVKAHLRALGVAERNIKFLTGTRATKGQIEAYVEDWLSRMVNENSRVFFYFSGHGAPDPGSRQAYLIPFDGDPNFLNKTAYSLKRLYASLGALKARSVLVALDSCFSGAGGRSVLAQGARPLVNQVDMGAVPGGKMLLFAAASANEITTTLDEQAHGIFTYYFLKGLGGEAQEASGAVTAQGLYRYLKPKVQDAAARQNRDQTPLLGGAAAETVVRLR